MKLFSRILPITQLVAMAIWISPVVVHADMAQCESALELEISAKQEVSLDKEPARELKDNYEARNKLLSERYPQLDFVFRDPEAFTNKMKERFEEQKRITPEDPRVFNFPEAAPAMKEILLDLEKFRLHVASEMRSQRDTFWNKAVHSVLGKRSSKVETLTKTLQYIRRLQSDIEQMISSGNYPYRDTVYNLYFYARIRGLFQFKELKAYYQATKYIDMWMHGYRRLSIDAEMRLYEDRQSPLLQVRSGKIAHEFRIAELPFRDAFERKDTLEYVIIPSVYALGASAFMHVLPHDIHFIGATNTPIEADGFNRPGGLFWMHDVRHEADRYMKINAYRKAQQLTQEQQSTLTLLMHKWHDEFLKFKSTITDPNLKASLDHYHFYTHHDVGVPLIPSVFLDHHKNGIAVYYAFLVHKKNAGQHVGFENWLANTQKAQELLTTFWEERLPLERQLLQRDPVRIEKWEDWFVQN